MALALIVERNCPEDIQDDTSRLFFYDEDDCAILQRSDALHVSSMLSMSQPLATLSQR